MRAARSPTPLPASGDTITLVRADDNGNTLYSDCSAEDVVDPTDPLCSSASPLMCRYDLLKERTYWVRAEPNAVILGCGRQCSAAA
jgi:hypothetical protein